MKARSLLIPFAALLLFGCSFVRFLHPLFEPRDLVFDPALLGSWRSAGTDSVNLVVTRGKDARYDLRAMGEGDSAVTYTFGMGRVGTQVFWDMVPVPASDEAAYLTLHQFAKIEWSGDELRLAMLNEQWFIAQILQGKLAVPYDTVLRNGESDTTFVILAKSSELKRLIGTIAADTAAFNEPILFRRSPAGVP